MKKRKKKRDILDNLPFSKKIIHYSRIESYVIALLLFYFVWMDKDISSLAVLASLSWGGYRAVQSFYLWMCKHEHIMDKKLEFAKSGINIDDIENALDELETTQTFEDGNSES